MASTDTLAAEPAPRRRRARLLSLLVTVLVTATAVVTGAWFALRRRDPALPTYPAEAGPGPGTTARPTPAAPPAVPPEPVEPEVPEVPVTEPVVPGSTAASTGSQDLQRVSGVGRRSAEALVAAGIDTLDRLAGSDDATLVAALEAAGLRRSPTLSSWASQARRLTQG